MTGVRSMLWVTWEKQRRNRSLSGKIGASLHEIVYAGPRFARYARSIYATIRVVAASRPTLLFAQNPSIVLALLALVLRSFGLCKAVIIDAHNAGIFPGPRGYIALSFLSSMICRFADFTIVTNSPLATVVHERGGRAIVLPDPLPAFDDFPTPDYLDRATYNVLFVCTWAADEPWQEVISAAEALGEQYAVYITGKFDKVSPSLSSRVPGNVTLTGFLPQEMFDALLQHSDIVVDLTTREDCLVCGAYEAIAADRLVLLSQTDSLQEYFGPSALYCRNSASSIKDMIIHSRDFHDLLLATARASRRDLAQRWDRLFESFMRTIQE